MLYLKLNITILSILLLLSNCLAISDYENKSTSLHSSSYVNNVKGTVQLLSHKSEWYVIIPDNDDTQRFMPTNLPDAFRKDGLRVIFSGKIGKLPADVRLIGTPLKLNKIKELD